MVLRCLKYIILLLLMFISREAAYAQTDNFRSLHKKLQEAKDSTAYTKALNSLSFYHHRDNLDSCFWYATQAMDIAQRLHDEKGKSYAYTNFALFYTRKRNTALGIIYNYKALQIDYALKDSGSISIDLSNLALAYRADGNLGKAQYYEQQSLELGSRYPELGDYKIDLINYLTYYWDIPSKSDSVKWALRELRTIANKAPYSMEWYETRLFEAMAAIKTKPFAETEKRINELAEEANKKGLPDEALTAYRHMINFIMPMGYKVDSIAYAEKMFQLARKIGNHETIMAIMPQLYAYYLARKDWEKIGRYGAAIRQLASYEQSEPGKLPAVDHISFFLKEQQLQELQVANQLQQHAMVQSDLQRAAHRILLQYLLILLVLLLILTFIYYRFFHASRRQTMALAALNAGIAEKNAQLQAGDDFKNRLLSLIAHDFRAPIKDILHTAALWREGSHDHQLMLDSIERVEGSSRRALDNFDGILRWIKSQFSHYQYTPVSCNLGEMFIVVAGDMQEEADNKDNSIVMDIPAATTVAADKEILQFVHRTLLRQILTLTGHGGTVSISATQHGGRSTVIVEGHPVNVTPALLHLLDGPPQEDSLILVTCKDFIDTMGGSLLVKADTPGTFALMYTLPA